MTIRDSYYPLILTLLVLDGIAVALRFWVRSSKNAAGYDDLAMAVSFVRYDPSGDINVLLTRWQVGFVVFCAMELAAISYGIGATNMESGFDMTKAAMVLFTCSKYNMVTRR